MIVSQKRGFIFFHNPKAAGTSFRTSIWEYHDFGRIFWGEEFSPYMNVTVDLAHLRSWELPCVAPNLFEVLESYRKLVFVRNPARRFISACFEHFAKFYPETDFHHKDAVTQRSIIGNLIETRLNHLTVLSDFQLVHFSPQKWYVFLGARRIADHILPVMSDHEDMSAAYDVLELPRRTLGREHRSSPERYRSLMDSTLDNFVKQFYRIDYEMLDSFDYLRPLIEQP